MQIETLVDTVFSFRLSKHLLERLIQGAFDLGQFSSRYSLLCSQQGKLLRVV